MKKLEVILPESWSQLSQEQLRFLLSTIVNVNNKNRNKKFESQEEYADSVAAQVNTNCFTEWTGLTVICQYGEGYLLDYKGEGIIIKLEALASAISKLDWTRRLPEGPVRLDEIDGAKAVIADLSTGFSFDSWLACESLWQQYQSTQADESLRLMAEILYNKEGIKLDDAETLSVFYWWASVKEMVSAMFPNFFKPANGEPQDGELSYDTIRRNIDAQIRALTKGDITKEKEVLALDAMRALTELDAQAREYDEINRKYPTK